MPPDKPPKSKPKPKGAQTGNDNAKKHGFYSGSFTETELALVAAFCADPSLDDEIVMQRVANLRIITAIEGEGDNETLARMYEALGNGLSRVARLLRDKRALSGDAADGLQAALSKAADEIMTELGFKP